MSMGELWEQTIPALFEEQVHQTPERVAVVFGGCELTYGELNRRANRLADYLRSLGVGPDQLVGLCAERSVELVVALVAIGKAGGAYVPLDPSYPEERLAFMLADTAAPVLLVQAHLRAKLPAHGARVVCLDTDWAAIEATGSEANPDSGVKARHLAYVSYTSGSTGRPKGVLVPHRAVVRLVRNNFADLGPDQVFLQLAPVPFDASTLEIWGALCSGARLVVMPPQNPTLAELAEALVEHGVTILWLTAGLFHLMVDHHLDALVQVRQVLAGGDVLSVPHVRRMLAALKPGHKLINGYGPTENTTFTCCFPMTAETQWSGSVPIGQPIAHTQCYVLDEHLQPVAPGEAGELYIGGDGLAHGYLNLPELTAERFLDTAWGRLYKSGDLVRWLDGGTIEFLGRTDNQVKIRGFRIELGEIEYRLAQHPAVGECVVLARQDEPGDKRLAAYVVPRTASTPTAADLRRYLGEHLPAYMLPSAFVFLEAFPLNPNGKVDRKALPAPEYRAEGEYVAPRTVAEEQLAAIWSGLLHRDQVGIHDDFFALGGHSLLATQIVSRVRQAFGVDMPLPVFFEAPTIAGLAQRIKGEAAGRQAPPLLPVNRGSAVPMSFAQARLWFFDQLAPDSPLYNIAEAIRLEGPLSTRLLEESLNRLVVRHEALRTNFANTAAGPVQVIRPAAPLRLTVADASPADVDRLAREEACLPFDLTADPLIRARLLRLGAQDHLLLLTVHHTVADGWSMGVLYAELGEIYRALAAGAEPGLRPLPVQYADFAQWQRAYLSGEVMAEHLDWWTRALAGAPTVLNLTADRPRPAAQSFRGARRSRVLAPALLAALNERSRQEGATPFMTMLAAFQAMLYRYTGQEDLLVGSVIANRNRQEIEGLIGFFVNMLPMRADLSGNPTFRQLLQQVRRRALGAFAHQDMPLEQLVEALQPERDPGRSPLVQVAFALQNAPMDDLQLPGVTVTNLAPTGVDTGTAKYDLLLTVEEAGGVTRAVVEYATDLFADETAERLLGHYEQLLIAIAGDPDQPVATLPLLTAAEERQVLGEWNQTRTDYPEATVQALFARQAAERPEAVAVKYGERTLTYGELDRASSQLAHRLRRLGVGPDVTVAVCLERSPLLIIALLAGLKAGGAYQPLDADYPADRLAFMVQDGQAPVLLTQESLAGRLPATEASVLVLDRDWAEIVADMPETAPPDLNHPDDLAYVIYTSGSTGRPKGTAIVHRAIVRLVFTTNYIEFSAADRVLQVSNASFDAFTFEIWGALLHGGVLVGMTKEVALTPVLMAETLRRERITAMFLTVALFNQVALEQPDAFHTTDTVIFGGEAADVAAVRAVLQAGGPRRLLNGYGPTESTTFATYYPVTTLASEATSVPIGYPISNTTCFVLDGHLQPVPVGVPGELCLGGDGLAREYLNQPQLTAERFVQTPLGRLYKTGDLVRWLPDGAIEYLGRLDHQVKIRGFRIELGEIETALGSHPAAGSVAVLVREDGPAGKRLVAYLTVRPGEAVPASSDLRAYLLQRLPDYMMPAAFMVLDSMPLSPNGKVDRKALPAPAVTEGAPDYAAPQGPLEEALAAIFADVLGVHPVSRHDRFFELGGHSLLAIQVCSRIREALQVELPLRTLFERQTVAELAHVLAGQTGASTGENGAPAVPAIRPVPRSGDLPLSFAQQRLWFFDQLAPGSTLYNVPIATRLRGPLSPALLEESLNRLVARHEVLRTTFATAGRDPVQVIAPELTLCLEAVPATEERLPAQIRAEAARPFDLAAGPLIRAHLFALGPAEHVLLVNMHHIIADGWSLGVLFGELGRIYTALHEGREPDLTPLPVHYADFAAWQQELLGGAEIQAQLAWWQQDLTGAPTVLALPTDRPRPAVQSYRGDRETRPLSPGLMAKLADLSNQEGATLYMTLLATFQVLLYRYTGQQDLLVGSAVAGRNRAEIEGLVGFFVGTLPMRADLSGSPTFRQFLRQVRERSLGALARQDVPLEWLVEVLQPERNPGISPLVQVLFTLQNAAMNLVSLPGVSASEEVPGGVHTGTAKYDLVLTVEETDGQSRAVLEYATDLFEPTTAQRLLRHFEQLLIAIAADPDRTVALLPMLTRPEEQQVLVDWNQTASDYPQATVHGLFARQAAARPEAVAVVYGERTLTYGELDRASSQLAHRLRGLGVGPDVPVGICLERSPLLVIALLATLKAGGAYLPLDPDYPADRLAFMVQDGQAPVLLTQASLEGRLTAAAAPVRVLDREWDDLVAGMPETAPADLNHPDHLAYVIYTSGSTGRPKGTAIVHRAIARLVFATNYITLSAADRVLQVSNASFDAFTFELWGALLHGGTLVGMAKEVALTPRLLAEALRRERITAMFLTTSLFNQVARELPDAFNTTGTVIFGGEAADVAAVRAVLKAGGPRRLVNGYGPTEATTFAVCYPVTDLPDWATSVPIGFPIGNTTCFVLDSNRQPVPVGVPGELYIGGAGLAREYINQPDLTAERFVRTPLGRLYRTGDMVRWLPDGTIEYLGRLDHQVKIRGFRIELGEIETALGGHPAVGAVAVLAREDGAAGKRLVAYLTARPGEEAPTPADLRAYLKERLPEYMVPAVFMVMKAMLLNPNGKIDRKALPAPDLAEGAANYVAPRTPLEEALAAVFAEVLAVRPISIHARFFDLGGHSLLATRAVSRIREVLQAELPLRALFERQTVAELAEVLAAQAGALSAPPIRPADRSGDLPLSFAQQRLWFLDEWMPGSALYNVPLAYRLSGPLNMAALGRAVDVLIARHESLRTTFARGSSGIAVQVIAPAFPVDLAVTDLSHLPLAEAEAEAERLAVAEGKAPFDLQQGPLFRAGLMRLAEGEHMLLLSMHHIISDGWSLKVMMQELAEAYGAYAGGRERQLPALPLQYADYAAWQQQWLSGKELEQQVAYWRQQLAGAPTVLELPTDRPRPPVMTYRGRRKAFAVPAHLEPALTDLSRREGVTLFMTLLAAWSVLLQRYSRQDEVLIGTPIAGRSRREVEGLIGFFVNTLVLRVGVHGEASFSDLLRQVKETAVGAYSHQDLPFEKLVDLVHPERNMSYTPLFQVMFALQETHLGDLALPGLTGRTLEPDTGTSKFDLALDIAQGPQGLTATLNWATDLFDEATIDRMGAHFVTLLEAIAANPAAPVSQLNLMPEAERQLVTVEWNRTEQGYQRCLAVHDLVERQAAASPDRTALVFGQESLTYGDLNRQANQLARYLQRLGVGPDVLVGVCMERCAALVVALLAIHKAGGAYLPLDPTYPADRLAYMLQDAQAPVLLTRGAAPVAFDGHTVDLQRDWTAIATEADGGWDGGAGPTNLAYVIYTSGSTGRPKGVAIEHRSAVNLLSSFQGWPGMTEADTLLAVTSISFDIHVVELWLTLSVGARVILASREEAQDGRRLTALMAQHGVTVMQGTPATYRLLLEGGFGSRPGMKLFVGGEALPRELAQRLTEGGGTLYNLYGPTETTVYSVGWQVDGGPILIGRPIANTQAYLLDPHRSPVPLGVPGELYLGGDGLARGYLHRPDLTAERFVQTPFGRLYRTGDLCRHRPDGQIEYLGRVDFQVKVRGFRIELGEIEAVLEHHPAIAQAVAAVREDAPGEKRIAAYVVVRGEAPTVADLRTYLKERLPDYMIPAAVVVLEQLPLTPSGKVDRKALPRPEAGAGEGRPFTAARTPVEAALAAIFTEVLAADRVSIDDNYFELGGDSIRSIRVRALAEEQGLPLALQDLFRHPTVRELAAALGESGPATPAAAVEPFGLITPADRQHLPQGVEDAYPVTRLQTAMLVSSLSLAKTYRNVTGYVLQLPFDAVALTTAARELVRRHAILRTAFDFDRFSEPLQLVYAEAELPLEVADLRGRAPDPELERWVEGELARRWDWKRAPLAALAAHRLSDATFRLSVSFHHAILDGWSVTGLMQELVERYKAHLQGRPLAVSPSAAAYRDYVMLEQEALASAAAQTYWAQQLAGFTPAVPFGAPPAAGHGAATENRYIEVTVDPAVSNRITAVSREAGVPVKSLLLGAHLRVLAHATGRADVMTGLVTNGRPEVAGGDELLGLFLNTVPLRLKLSHGSTWLDLGRQALAAEAALLPHRRFPLADMQSGPGGAPPVEMYFNYTNFQDGRSQPEVIAVVNAAWSSFPLAAEFYMDAMAGTLRIFLEYDSRRFRLEHAQALALCYQLALAALAADPEAPCDDPLVNIDELTDEQVDMLLAIMSNEEGH
jgi:amino acid adenylation domain-containing protein